MVVSWMEKKIQDLRQRGSEQAPLLLGFSMVAESGSCSSGRLPLQESEAYFGHPIGIYFQGEYNASVLQKASAKPLSQMLLSSQKKLYNKMATYDSSSFVKRLLFNENGTLRDWSARRKRGRPRQQWTSSMHKFAHNNCRLFSQSQR